MTSTRSHTRSIDIPAAPDSVFSALITPSAIRSWWSAARAIVLPKTGGLWAATLGAEEDSPDYITVANISELDRPKRLVLSDYRYFNREGPLPFEADFVVAFVMEPISSGTRLSVTHRGFPCDPVADGFLAGCELGWLETLGGIRRFFEPPSGNVA